MICPKGGFPTIRHNDLTASLLTNVCHNVATEPRLQPLSGEFVTSRSAITTNEARLDIHAMGFWSTAMDAYFDVRVFHPHATSKTTKKRAYGQRVRDIEHGVFTPLVFTTTGGRQPSSTKD